MCLTRGNEISVHGGGKAICCLWVGVYILPVHIPDFRAKHVGPLWMALRYIENEMIGRRFINMQFGHFQSLSRECCLWVCELHLRLNRISWINVLFNFSCPNGIGLVREVIYILCWVTVDRQLKQQFAESSSQRALIGCTQNMVTLWMFSISGVPCNYFIV